jgi:hypothetical protein
MVLQQLPHGMEEFYNRMASNVNNISSHANRVLAIDILQLVTCSMRVLTVLELAQFLGKDNEGILDLSRTVVDLCGGFVTVDNDENVTLIHQTAREYLVDNQHTHIQISILDGNKRLLQGCMQAMNAIGLQGKIIRNQKPVLLDYATSAWSGHLQCTALGDPSIILLVKKFLSSKSVLSWIHALGATENLRELIQTSKQLSKFASRLDVENVNNSSESTLMLYRGLLESWSLDLVKLVGKFGAELRRTPESIYRAIPPFAPHSSSLYQLAGKSEAKNLSVSGLSKQIWDDSLARMSFDSSSYGSTVNVAGAHIAVLTSSSQILIYESATFQDHQMSPINHGERLYLVTLNKSGTLLASYGYRTTKIWDLVAGVCRSSAPNNVSTPTPLTLCFSQHGKTLQAACSDSCIYELSVTDSSPCWKKSLEVEDPELDGYVKNCPDNIAINLDESLVVFSYRNYPISAWELDGPYHINHCFRARDEVALGEVSKLIWHPHQPILFGLYMEGVIFKWFPYENVPATELRTGASRMSMNSTGALLVTGDVNGMISIYTTASLSLIYLHVSQDVVMDIVFSPDSLRIYDIRGYYGNVIEPLALSKFIEQRNNEFDTDSETESIVVSATASSLPIYKIDPIRVIAASPKGGVFCSGSERGSVAVHMIHDGSQREIHTSQGFLDIIKMVWSTDGMTLCFADIAKRVFIVQFILDTAGDYSIGNMKAIKVVSPRSLLQLVFKEDSSAILVVTTATLQVIDLRTGTIECVSKTGPKECWWIVHPIDAGYLLGFGLDSVYILDWGLHLLRSYKYKIDFRKPRSATLPSRRQENIERAIVSKDKQQVLLHASVCTGENFTKVLLYFNSTSLSDDPVGDTFLEEGAMRVVPRDIVQHVNHILAFLPSNKMIFLSKQNVVCAIQMVPELFLLADVSAEIRSLSLKSTTNTLGRVAPSAANYRELFPLPGDWISRDCLETSCIWAAEKSFLCPRNGEVAVVKSAALV